MENIQINGQKIWGPPKDWVGPPPPHGTEVFVRNIPDDVFEYELFHLFSTVGKVYEVRLPVHWNGNNKGYAFVRYTKISEADDGIEKLNLYMIRVGRLIQVERSLDNTRLFLSSVPDHKIGEELKNDLLTVVENVEKVYVYPSLADPTIFRGYAFVEFQCHRDAAIAKRVLTPDVLFKLFATRCVSAWANPLPYLSKETLKTINVLFMRNIPRHMKNIIIKFALDAVVGLDTVEKVKRLNDFAFVTFKDHETAEMAMDKLKCNPFFLSRRPVHVEWAIPRELAHPSLRKMSLTSEDSEGKLGHNGENVQYCVKVVQDWRYQIPPFICGDYNMEAGGLQIIPFGFSPTRGNWTVLQRPTTKPEALPPCKAVVAYNPQTNQNCFYDYSTNFQTENPKLWTPIYVSKSEDPHPDFSMMKWLRSLPLPGEFSSFGASRNSPSAASSPNLSCKCDEGRVRFQPEEERSSGMTV